MKELKAEEYLENELSDNMLKHLKDDQIFKAWIIDAMYAYSQDYARIQIEKDRERVKEKMNFNDDGLNEYIDKLITETPITLD